jgi:magnesium-transporting ATPase (P-type)
VVSLFCPCSPSAASVSQDESKRLVEVRVQRNGVAAIVGTADVVVGDIVFLETGVIVPADGILLRGSDLKVCTRAYLRRDLDHKAAPACPHACPPSAPARSTNLQ